MPHGFATDQLLPRFVILWTHGLYALCLSRNTIYNDRIESNRTEPNRTERMSGGFHYHRSSWSYEYHKFHFLTSNETTISCGICGGVGVCMQFIWEITMSAYVCMCAYAVYVVAQVSYFLCFRLLLNRLSSFVFLKMAQPNHRLWV